MYECPICKEMLKDTESLARHLVRHEDFTKNMLNILSNQDDLGYFFSCLKYEDDEFKTELWYNS